MKDFNKYFDYIQDEDTKLLVKKIVDKVKLVNKNYVCSITDFVNDNVINYSIPILNNENVNFKLFPAYEFSDRKSLILFPDYMDESYDETNPSNYFTAFRVANKSKFKELDHKNYLGSLMSLGIDRNKIGDIYVHDEFADIICQNEIKDVISFNLDKVGHNKIEIKEINLDEIAYKEPDNEVKVITVTSMRLDNIVKSLINKSRDICVDLINSGDVRINYEVLDKPAANLKENDLISIRKFGRFKIEKQFGVSKSDKVKLEVKYYKKN